MPRKKSITVADIEDLVLDAAEAIEQAAHTTLSEDEHEELTKLLTAFIIKHGVDVTRAEPTPLVLGCAHGRPAGALCPHCMGIS